MNLIEDHLGRVQSRSRPEWHCHGGGTSGEGPACVRLDVDDSDEDKYIQDIVQSNQESTAILAGPKRCWRT